MINYTAEQVESAAEILEQDQNAPSWKRLSAMLIGYATLLREREAAKAGGTDDIARKLGDEYFRLCKLAERKPLQAGFWLEQLRAALEAVTPMLASAQPIPLILHCPSCGLQHIDAPEVDTSVHLDGRESRWDNPPHRSHLCHRCGTIWRPADVATVGVEKIQTQGKNDVMMPAPMESARMPKIPTEKMLVAARDWSYKKYGKPIGNDAATECWQVMLTAAPKPEKE